MKVYGSKFYAHQEEAEESEIEEFAEITIVCNMDELEKLANFFNEELTSTRGYLNKTKNDPEIVAGEMEHFYPHYSLWDKQWKIGSPDFVIAISAKR